MGLFAKLKNGKKKFYKAIQKCDSTNNGGVVIACSKDGRDLKQLVKDGDEEIVKALFSHHCSKCSYTFDDLALEDVRGAKKIYELKEI
jgi:hypothetical protein